MAEIKDINKSPGIQDTHQAYYHSGNIPDASSKSLQLTGILQSTLELNKILELFDDEISSIVPHDGLCYDNHEEDYTIKFGEDGRHRCSYQLVLLDKDLGELNFFRNTKFSGKEIKQLETMIAALIYPLRNALLYKRAVDKAHRDPVTGVNNRTGMDSALAQELNLARRHHTALSLIILDIDKFKHINDAYGHIAGDVILKRVADCIQECVRGSDIIYRYGGEEFVVLLRNTRKPGATRLAERIRESVESMHFKYDDFKVRITISAGLSSFKKSDSVKNLLERCDSALYQAKKQGRNRVVVAEN
ncbi:MAG: GGDEF domain-containing protein [Gammaproteobacteria bacterium]